MSRTHGRVAKALWSLALLFGAATLSLHVAGSPALSQAPRPTGFTDWGWPLPYEKISAASIRWLRERGWWPLQVAWQSPFSGQNTIMLVIRDLDLLGKRGIEARFHAFEAGPPINEAFLAGRIQVGVGGNFPFTTLLDRGVPLGVLAILAPNLGHAVVVPRESPIRKLTDFKGRSAPAIVGIVTGSSAEFFFQSAAKVVGLDIGKDVVLKPMPPSEQALMPRGIDAVVPWDPTVALVTEVRKTGRVVEWIFPYNFYQGNLYVPRELIEGAAEVAQAITDAYVEAALWIRRYPEQALDIMAREATLQVFPRGLLRQQIRLYNLLYKPTVYFPHADFWAEENSRIATWLRENGRLTREITYKTYFDSFQPRFMTQTFAKLGWRVPSRPVFLPPDWKGAIGTLPYPPYYNAATLKTPQPFPERGDLVRPWWFAGKLYSP